MIPKKYDLGRMRNQVVWQSHDGSVDAMNEPKDSGWATVGTHFAEVTPTGGLEDANARQEKGIVKGTIKMRNVGAIKPSDRFLFEDTGRILDITSVVREGERNAYLLIEYTEQVVPQ